MLGRLSETAWPCVISAVAMLVLSLGLERVLNSDNIAASIIIGALTAQLSSLAIYVCFSKGEFWLRLCPILIGLAVVALTVLLKDQQAAPLQEKAKSMFELLGILPLLVGAAQFPLWLIRAFAGWRLAPSGSATERDAPWSIRDSMAGTFVCSLMLAGPGWRTPPEPKVMDLYWPVVIGMSIFVTCATVASVPLAVWLVLRKPGGVRGAAWFALIVWFVYFGVFSGFAVVYAVWEWEPFRQLALFVMSYAASLLLSLVGCHLMGFRLVTRWDKATSYAPGLSMLQSKASVSPP